MKTKDCLFVCFKENSASHPFLDTDENSVLNMWNKGEKKMVKKKVYFLLFFSFFNLQIFAKF